MTKKYINSFIYLVLFSVCCVYFYHLYNFPLYHDGPYLLPATNIPGSGTLEYWFGIFTSQNHGPQYRPLSFFVFFKIMGSVLQNIIWQYHLIGSILFFLCCIYFYKTLEKLKTSPWINVSLVLLFIASPYHYNISEITFIAKYYLTQLILILGIYISLTPSLTLKKNILLSLLSLIAIMTHEGSITFFATWLAFRFSNGLDLKKQNILIVLPTLFYIFVRIFIFGVPGHGFMKISWLFLFDSIETFMNHAWTANSLEQGYLYTLFLVLISISLSMFYFKKNKNLICILLFSIVIASPFMLLENHSTPDRVIWLSIFPSLFLKEFTKEFNAKEFFMIMIITITIIFENKQIGSFIDIRQRAVQELSMNKIYIDSITSTIDENKNIPVYIKLYISDDSFSFMNIKAITGSVSIERPSARLLLSFTYPEQDKQYEEFEFQIFNGSSSGCLNAEAKFCKDIFMQNHSRLLKREETKEVVIKI